MKFSLVLTAFSLFPFASLSSANEFKPRKVVICSIEGTLGIFETKPGEFAFVESVGFMGSGVQQVPATLRTEKQKDSCVVSAEFSLPGGKTRTQKFYFSSKKDPFSGNATSLKGISCRMSKRYQESLAKCYVPTATEPGDKCYGATAPPLPITIEGATFDAPDVRLALNSGGLAVATYPSPKDRSKLLKDQAIESEPFYFKIKLKDNKWCIRKTEYSTDYNEECDPFPTNSNAELRNNEGFIVGVVSASGNGTLLVKQVKRPYAKQGYQIEKSKPGIEIRVTGATTVASQVDLNTGLSSGGGSASIEGERGRIDFYYGNDTRVNLSSAKSIRSDCNGPKEASGGRDNTEQKDGKAIQ